MEAPPKKKIKNDEEKRNNTSPKERANLEQVVEVDGKMETHVYLSPHTPAGDPPEPEELIKAIQDLENTTASADEGVRQRIAQLPPEVSNISVLAKIEGFFVPYHYNLFLIVFNKFQIKQLLINYQPK